MKVSEGFTRPGRLHATYNFDLLEWAGLSVDGMKDVISAAIAVFNDTGRLSLPSRIMTFRVRRHASLPPSGFRLKRGMRCSCCF